MLYRIISAIPTTADDVGDRVTSANDAGNMIVSNYNVE